MQHKIYNTIKNKKKQIDNNIVVNLSKTKLTLSQNYVLNKGLNFCSMKITKIKSLGLLNKASLNSLDAFKSIIFLEMISRRKENHSQAISNGNHQ